MIAFVVTRVDLSSGSRRAIVIGLCVGTLFSWEERFTRWWDMRRLRRELARRPIAHRKDAAER